MVWSVLQRCDRQIRVGFSGPVGLDFAAILAMGKALDAPMDLLADVLPLIETALLRSCLKDADTNGEPPDDHR
jgi:hypothetical protein